MRVLVVRPDRLGDVLLSTPVFQALKKAFPNGSVSVLVRENVRPLLEGLPCVDEVRVFDPAGRHSGWAGFLRLFREVRSAGFNTAVVLQSHWKIALILFLARIPKRIGPYSKLYSFLLFNRGIRQHRSKVEKHETDYNLQLLSPLGIHTERYDFKTRVSLSNEAKARAKSWLVEHGWNPAVPLVAVHPGMGGSALNWPEENYVDLSMKLLSDGIQVLVTSGPLEQSLSMRLEKVLNGRGLFYRAGPSDQLDFLGGLYSLSSLVVAPSTGPLHLAVALEVPVVTFYPPIRVQSAERWGPYTESAAVFTPDVNCDQSFKCLGKACRYFFCMNSLNVEKAFSEIKRRIHGVAT